MEGEDLVMIRITQLALILHLVSIVIEKITMDEIIIIIEIEMTSQNLIIKEER